MSIPSETPCSSIPRFDDELSLGRIRAALVQHRRRLDESERAFRQWQAQWWLRERVIEQQIRRVQLQLAGLSVTLAARQPLLQRCVLPRTPTERGASAPGLVVIGLEPSD
jgi:hypothetical protein